MNNPHGTSIIWCLLDIIFHELDSDNAIILHGIELRLIGLLLPLAVLSSSTNIVLNLLEFPQGPFISNNGCQRQWISSSHGDMLPINLVSLSRISISFILKALFLFRQPLFGCLEPTCYL